jgi:hypothetical protein
VADMSDTILLSDDEIAGAVAGCAKGSPFGRERRASNRCTYSAVQPVAASGAWGFPKPELFNTVRCRVISTGGISF